MSELSPSATHCSHCAVLLAVIELVRNHPEFDSGGPMVDAMDQALRGETPKLIVDVAYLRRGLKPPETSPSATVGEEEIKRFRIGDILFTDEQAQIFCEFAMQGLRAAARANTEQDTITPSATARVPLAHTAYSATTGDELRALLGMFTPDIRLVTQDGERAEAYYRIESDGEGVIVVKSIDAPQVGDPRTNGGCLERT